MHHYWPEWLYPTTCHTIFTFRASYDCYDCYDIYFLARYDCHDYISSQFSLSLLRLSRLQVFHDYDSYDTRAFSHTLCLVFTSNTYRCRIMPFSPFLRSSFGCRLFRHFIRLPVSVFFLHFNLRCILPQLLSDGKLRRPSIPVRHEVDRAFFSFISTRCVTIARFFHCRAAFGGPFSAVSRWCQQSTRPSAVHYRLHHPLRGFILG